MWCNQSWQICTKLCWMASKYAQKINEQMQMYHTQAQHAAQQQVKAKQHVEEDVGCMRHSPHIQFQAYLYLSHLYIVHTHGLGFALSVPFATSFAPVPHLHIPIHVLILTLLMLLLLLLAPASPFAFAPACLRTPAHPLQDAQVDQICLTTSSCFLTYRLQG